MKKAVLYTYLGTNGTICSPVHLEDIYYTRKIHLSADVDKLLTKNGKDVYRQIIIPEDEVNDWYEINKI